MHAKAARRLTIAVLSLLASLPALVAAQGATASDSLTRPVISEHVAPLVRFEPIGSDGHRGEGFLRKPPGGGPFPAVVFIHGGLNRQTTGQVSRYTLRANASRFLEAGYVIAAITYRSRDLDPQSPDSLVDSLAAVEHVKKLAYVDADSVAVNGCSGGGDLVLDVAGKTEVAATVSEEPATLLFTGMFSSNLPRAGASYSVADALPMMLDPGGSFTEEAQRITREKIDGIKSPVFIVQGDQPLFPGGPDHLRVQDEILIPALEAAGVDLSRKVYPGQEHCFAYSGSTEASLAAFEDIDAFLREHVPTKPVGIDAANVEHVPLNEPLRSAVTVPDEILQDYVGIYVLANGAGRIQITLDGGQLAAEMVGQPRLFLYPESESVFYGHLEFEQLFEFARSDDGDVTHFIVNGGFRADRQ
jgi:dipeptidyl aminopeptidase/acylaminoacyl peptidase